jgi:ABC-type glycerol-3-phosphate transport system substrate-binding protein
VRKLLVLLAAVALLGAGCGGGGSSKGTTTAATTTAPGPPLTKAAYQAKLSEFSKEARQKLGTTSKSFDKLTTTEVQELVDALHGFAAKLRSVTPPPAVKALHAQLIAAMDDLADEFPGIAKKLKATKDPSVAISTLFGAKGFQELIKVGAGFQKAGFELNLNG